MIIVRDPIKIRSGEDQELYNEVIESLMIKVISYYQKIDLKKRVSSTNEKPTKLVKQMIAFSSLDKDSIIIDAVQLRKTNYEFHDSLVDVFGSDFKNGTFYE